VPSVELWEGVALSMNIEPREVRREYSWKAEARFYHESQEFNDRLLVATRNVTRHWMLRPTAKLATALDESRVDLPYFAAFADSLNWNIPPELKQLARLPPALQMLYPNVDVPHDLIAAANEAARERLIGEEVPAAAAPTSTSGESRRLSTLQRLVLAMAKAKYGWVRGARNEATGEKAESIYADVIAQLGEDRKIEAETIRKVLNEADDAFPSQQG
jgi:hypothetical protein